MMLSKIQQRDGVVIHLRRRFDFSLSPVRSHFGGRKPSAKVLQVLQKSQIVAPLV